METEINRDDFPGCCGVEVIYTFPSDADLKQQISEDKDEIESLKDDNLVTNEEEAIKVIVASIEDSEDSAPCKLITLNDNQLAAQKAAVKAGYVALGTFKGRSGNVITMFAKGMKTMPLLAARKVSASNRSGRKARRKKTSR